MEEAEDVFGRIIYAHYKDEESAHAIEREDGYLDIFSSAQPYFREFDEWSELEKESIYYVDGKILDIGCGAGRHCLYLQQNGFDIVGIDSSPLAIKTCKLRGVKQAKILSIHDITKDIEKFDNICMFGANFGLFGNPSNAKRLLKIFYEITSDEGIIIASSNKPYPTTIQRHLNYHELNRSRGRMAGQITMRIRFQHYVSTWMDYLMVTQDEMKEILLDTGWKIQRILELEELSSFIAVIRKVNV